MAGSGGGANSSTWRKGNELTGGACKSVVEERRGGLAKCTTLRRKSNFTITPWCFGPPRPAKEAVACRGRAGWRRQTRPDPLGDSNGNLIFEFQ
jgi:hypothetical protein